MKVLLKKINLFILGFFICFMLAGSIKHISIYAEMTVNITKDKSLWIIFGSLILLISVFLFSKFVERKIEKIKWIESGLWIVLFIGELLYLCCFHCLPTSDSAEVVNGAVELAKGNSYYMAGREYFLNYSNNSLLTIATSWIYGLCKIIFKESTNFILINNILNIIFLNLSIYFAYAIVKHLKGEKNACKTLFLAVINPIQYMALSWYYSATISTFFSMAILYLILVKRQSPIQRKVQMGLVGLLTGIGLFLRPTVCITTIAIIIVEAFLMGGQKDKKKFWGQCSIGVAVCILSIVCLKCLVYHYVPDNSKNYPITHWISMGLEGNGTNESYGANYPKEIKSRSEMLEYDLKRIEENLSHYTVVSFGKHIAEKVFINWCDGSAALSVKMKSDTNFSKAYDYMVSQRADGWLIYCQAFRSIIYLLMLFAILRSWKEETKEEDILWLNLSGAMLFYLIWEVKSDYCIPFIPLFCCLASGGMECNIKISDEKKKWIGRKVVSCVIVMIGIFGIVLMEKNRAHYISDRYFIKEHVIAMNNMKRLKSIQDLGEEKKQLMQWMDIEKNFNYIKLYCKKLSGKGTYHIQLYNAKGQCVEDWNNISKKQIEYGQEKKGLQYEEGNQKGYMLLNCNGQQSKGVYYLKIVCNDNKDSIKWYYSDYVNFDYYEGDLMIDNQKQEGELAVNIGNQSEQPYMSKVVYRVIEGLIIVYVVFCLLGYYKITLLGRKEENVSVKSDLTHESGNKS